MDIKITFKNMEHTPSLDTRIREKTEKMSKFLNGNIRVKWTCQVHDGAHRAEVVLLGPKFEYHASAHSDCLYKTLDLAVEKLQKQLVKQKDKWKNQVHQKRHLRIVEPDMVWDDYDADKDYDDVA